jgi:sugar phosphate isomerase/epimerase
VRPVTGEPGGPEWIAAGRTLTRLAELGERAGLTFTLENLNTAVDHPGVPFAPAADTLALVAAVGRPGLRMNLDLYHAQIAEGNLIALLRRPSPTQPPAPRTGWRTGWAVPRRSPTPVSCSPTPPSTQW